MPEKTRIYLPLALSIILAIGMLLGAKMQDKGPIFGFFPKDEASFGDAPETLEEIIRYIDARYVDSVDRDTLYQTAIAALFTRLDPHSAWLSAEEVQKVQESRDGHFSGVGLEYMITGDTVWVIRALPGSPALEAGIKPGDRLLQIGDTLLGSMPTQQRIARLMRGSVGSTVNLRISREGLPEIEVALRRSNVTFPSVMPGIMLDDSCGYIAIQRFGSATYREFMEEFEVLQRDKGMKHLLIDLRGNPGGYLEEATNILSQLFQEKDRMLVYTLDKKRERKEFRSTGKIFFPVDRIVILVDERSASASEVIAGAIQDWDRGLVVGRQTFGKGLVQEQYPLKNGSALLLTTARYYTPSGRSIQREYHHREASERDAGISVHPESGYYTSKGRSVLGGGGIMPDVILPKDSTLTSEDHSGLQALISEFLFSELRKPRTSEASDDVWGRFKSHTSIRRPDLSTALEERVIAEPLQIQLLGDLARAIGGEALQQETIARLDGEIKKALDILKDKRAFANIGQ